MSDRVHTCPVCGGCGTVPHDFYNRHGMSTSTARESCRSCLGRGIIVTEPSPYLKGSDPDYSPSYQDEYQRLWHEARADAETLRQALRWFLDNGAWLSIGSIDNVWEPSHISRERREYLLAQLAAAQEPPAKGDDRSPCVCSSHRGTCTKATCDHPEMWF